MNWVWSTKGNLVFVSIVHGPWSIAMVVFINSLVVCLWSLFAEGIAKEGFWHLASGFMHFLATVSKIIFCQMLGAYISPKDYLESKFRTFGKA